MPRNDGSGGTYSSTKQKGKRRTGSAGTYCTKKKRKDADKYDRPYLDGGYRQWASQSSDHDERASRRFSPGHHTKYRRTPNTNPVPQQQQWDMATIIAK